MSDRDGRGIPDVRQPLVTPALVWRTVRHLSWEQIAGQLRQRVRRLSDWPSLVVPRERDRYPGCRWEPGQVHVPPPGGQRQDPEELARGRFRFLNETRELGFPPDWEVADASHLWRYNLHYFEWLWDLSYDEGRTACLDWIARHPLGRGRVGWEPYPLSLRLQSWLPWLLGRHRDAVERDAAFADALWQSVARQVRWLLRRLERHIGGNHLLENGIALTLAGTCFAGDEPRAWQRAGKLLLERELGEQFLPDGLHYERSPMYHVRLLYALLVLAAAEPEDWREWLAPVLDRGLDALGEIVHPDGEVALFNDSAPGVQPAPEDLFRLGERLGFSDRRPKPQAPISLKEAGYHGLRAPGGDALIVDAGPIGPDHQPGHGHADMLSFELSIGGRRVVIDPGVGSYRDPRSRAFARSTAAHSTLEIAGRSQVELWGSFRVGRRVRPRGVTTEWTVSGFDLAAEHDGYALLPGAPVHRRRVRLDVAPRNGAREADRALTVVDHVTVGKRGRGMPVVARVIFAPEVSIAAAVCPSQTLQKGPATWRATVGDDAPRGTELTVTWRVEGPRPGEVWVEQVPVFPGFGVVRLSRALVLRGELPLEATFRLAWSSDEASSRAGS